MIYGIGTDVCDVRRIRASLERHGDRFAEKVLGERELAGMRDLLRSAVHRGTGVEASIPASLKIWRISR